MSIERESGLFYVSCDKCPACLGPFDTFEEAVQAKKHSKTWKSVFINGRWEDRCFECTKENIHKVNGKTTIDFGG